MKYRAGVSPKRTNPKRKTEYEYKYDWKKPMESTPLLAAEQVRNFIFVIVPLMSSDNKSNVKKSFTLKVI